MSVSSGHAIFVNGIPSAGKSSVASEIRRRDSTFRILTGDEVVRQALGGDNSTLQVSRQQLPSAVKRVFSLTLNMIEQSIKSNNVVVDGAWTKDQVTEAQSRFGASGLYVILRIDEPERQKRESARTDRRLTSSWDPAWHDMPGPDEIYDLVLDSGVMDVLACVDAILAECVERWGDPL